MRSLIDIHSHEGNDLRHLLYEYDESVDQTELVPIYDNIMQEYESLSGSGSYKKHFQETDIMIWDGHLIEMIKITIECLMWGRKDLGQQMIDEFRLKIELNKNKIIDDVAISKLENRLKSIINKYKLKKIKNKEQKQASQTWEDLRVNIHEILNILPEYDCTVSQYLAYEKAKKRKIDAQKANKWQGK